MNVQQRENHRAEKERCRELEEFTAAHGSEINTWLTEAEQTSVAIVIDMLEDLGVTLRFPHTSGIANSRKLREPRIQHAGQPYRVLYAFDPKRNAVLLLGGNKTGDRRWYEKHVPRAEKLFAACLEETGHAG